MLSPWEKTNKHDNNDSAIIMSLLINIKYMCMWLYDK